MDMNNDCVPYCERIGNLHIHTSASDGSGDHNEVAQAAARAGLDFIIITDHDVYLPEKQGWKGPVLVLVGEELRARADSPGNHYLVLNAGEEMRDEAGEPQHLIDAVSERGGLGFIAHPVEHAGAISGEKTYNWQEWYTKGFTGIEIWNYMSEFKSYLSSLFTALLYVLAPKLAIRGPFVATMAAWDDALAEGDVWAIGGSDAHAQTYRKGPLSRQVFSYEHLFRAVNTHVLVKEPWNGDLTHDAGLIYTALGSGKAFVAYDALAPARGFDFTAVWQGQTYAMGDTFTLPAETPDEEIRFEVMAPHPAHLRLIRNGLVIAQARGMHLVYTTREPGVYRVEAYRHYHLRDRGWIYSNPIRVCSA